MPKRQTCTKCGKPSIPGLLRGHGKCQYHWNEGAFGKRWADHVAGIRPHWCGPHDPADMPEPPVCPNCGQYQRQGDCLNECTRRGFAR